MPPRTALSTPLRAWKCPSCSARSFTTSHVQQQVGPEHPRYIEVPEPPQHTVPARKWVKGILPVPRNLFPGSTKHDKSDEETIAKTTLEPQKRGQYQSGSRDEWKTKVSDLRRRNLREGIRELKSRHDRTLRSRSETALRRGKEREEALHKPEREDERLTAPSHNLDLEALLHGAPQDPTREYRLAVSRKKNAAHNAEKQAERLDSLHTLYTHARSFIVTPQQLDEAVDKTFGTNERPVAFGETYDRGNAHSIWALGRPDRVNDMLNRASSNQSSRFAVDLKDQSVNERRMRKIAEMLTGGTMEDSEKPDDVQSRRM